MEYYIDGHNLIPKVGLRLNDENDEEKLLERVQEYARITRRKCTVFFDRAPDPSTRRSRYGSLNVYYVTHRTTADEEIIAMVNNAGSRAREITVVSSDQHIQRQIRYVGAQFVTSEQFAREMQKAYQRDLEVNPERHNNDKLSESEVDEWMKIFGLE